MITAVRAAELMRLAETEDNPHVLARSLGSVIQEYQFVIESLRNHLEGHSSRERLVEMIAEYDAQQKEGW